MRAMFVRRERENGESWMDAGCPDGPTDCQHEGSHVGPVVPSGHEIIDGGAVIYWTCETCGAVGESSTDLADVTFADGAS